MYAVHKIGDEDVIELLVNFDGMFKIPKVVVEESPCGKMETALDVVEYLDKLYVRAIEVASIDLVSQFGNVQKLENGEC